MKVIHKPNGELRPREMPGFARPLGNYVAFVDSDDLGLTGDV